MARLGKFFYISVAPTFDSDAQAFFDRVTTAGGTLTTTEKQAVNQLVITMKADGTWGPCKVIYPMVGASAAACAQNLKSSSFTGTFSSGWTFASTGATPNGTSAYMDTNFNMLTDYISTSNASIGAYIRTNTGSGTYDMGAGDNIPVSNGMLIMPTLGGTFYGTAMGGLMFESNTNAQGFYCMNRDGGSQYMYKRGNITINKSAVSAVGSISSLTIYIGSSNSSQANYKFSDKETAFNFIGDKLTQTEVSNFYTAVQAFQTTLGRQV
jgi:hypothetical protein